MSQHTHEISFSYFAKIFNLAEFKKTLLKRSGGEEPMCLDKKADLPTWKMSADVKLSEVT
jgi:hypothetical protein